MDLISETASQGAVLTNKKLHNGTINEYLGYRIR